MDLGPAGRRHDPSRVDLDDALRRRERHHRSLVDPDRRVPGEDVDPVGRVRDVALVAEDHPLVPGGGGDGGGAARRARPDDEHVAVEMPGRACRDRPVRADGPARRPAG